MTRSIFTSARMAAVASAGALAVSLSAPAVAEDAKPYSFSANIGVVSNYMWRGVTQTQDGPAVQGGLDFTHESGFSAGIWASNVDFNDEGASQIATVKYDEYGNPMFDDNGYLIYETVGSSDSDSANYELDFTLGYSGNITDDFSYGLGATYYAYPDGKDSNFAELSGTLTFKWFTIGTAYTVYGENDGGRNDDGDWYSWASFDYSELPFGLGIGLRGGYYSYRHDQEPTGQVYVDSAGNLVYVTDSADYWNYGASITKDAGDFGTFSLNWDQNDGNSDLGYDNDPKIWVGWNKEF